MFLSGEDVRKYVLKFYKHPKVQSLGCSRCALDLFVSKCSPNTTLHPDSLNLIQRELKVQFDRKQAKENASFQRACEQFTPYLGERLLVSDRITFFEHDGGGNFAKFVGTVVSMDSESGTCTVDYAKSDSSVAQRELNLSRDLFWLGCLRALPSKFTQEVIERVAVTASSVSKPLHCHTPREISCTHEAVPGMVQTIADLAQTASKTLCVPEAASIGISSPTLPHAVHSERFIRTSISISNSQSTQKPATAIPCAVEGECVESSPLPNGDLTEMSCSQVKSQELKSIKSSPLDQDNTPVSSARSSKGTVISPCTSSPTTKQPSSFSLSTKLARKTLHTRESAKSSAPRKFPSPERSDEDCYKESVRSPAKGNGGSRGSDKYGAVYDPFGFSEESEVEGRLASNPAVKKSAKGAAITKSPKKKKHSFQEQEIGDRKRVKISEAKTPPPLPSSPHALYDDSVTSTSSSVVPLGKDLAENSHTRKFCVGAVCWIYDRVNDWDFSEPCKWHRVRLISGEIPGGHTVDVEFLSEPGTPQKATLRSLLRAHPADGRVAARATTTKENSSFRHCSEFSEME